MYAEFFGLTEKPFALVPDTRYLFLSESHREALAHVLYGIREGEGFIEVVGQVGTGKTTLCRTLLERVENDVEVGFIFNPSSSEVELLAAINREFGIPASAETRTELIDELNRFLLRRRASGRRVLLVIDEAQNLTPAVLEQIRLLSNLETERGKLLQILLLGQPELDGHLARSDLRQLRQRISVRWELRPLNRAETEAYVEHRLRIAGAQDLDLFTPGAMSALYRASGGVPRLVNSIADRALLMSYSDGRQEIEARFVRRAARELPGARAPRAIGRSLAIGARVAALMLVGLVGGVAFASWMARTDGPALSQVGAPAVAERIAPADLRDWLHVRTEGATSADALDAMLETWGYEPLGYEELLPQQFSTALVDHTSLLVLEMWSDLDGLRQIDLPTMLEVEPVPGALRYVAWLGEDSSGALVLRAGDRVFRVSKEDAASLLTGRALLLWTNFDSVPPLRAGMVGTAVEWLQDRLASLGYLPGASISGRFDEDTLAAVRRLQAEYALDLTGEVDPATLITIYQALQYGAPELSGGIDLS
jgi:general secretion pathway protein A